MKSTKRVIRKVIYDALSNVISVPVFDEKRHVDSTANAFVLLSTQQETNDNTQDSFLTLSSIDIEIVVKTSSEISKDRLDDIEDEILEILLPTPITDGISTYSGFQIANFRRDRSITRLWEMSPTETVQRTIITITATIVQQF